MRIFNEIVELTVSNSDESKAKAVSNELPVREAVIRILPNVEGMVYMCRCHSLLGPSILGIL